LGNVEPVSFANGDWHIIDNRFKLSESSISKSRFLHSVFQIIIIKQNINEIYNKQFKKKILLMYSEKEYCIFK